METFGKFMAGLIMIVLSAIIQGFVLSKLWAWFIVGLLSVHQITILQAIGLSMVVGYFRIKYDPSKKDNDEAWDNLIKGFLFMLLYSAFALLFGCLVHQMML